MPKINTLPLSCEGGFYLEAIMKIIQDMHIHTFLSSCSSDPAQNPAAMLAWAMEHGITTLCFTDHFWDEAVPGASDWYAPQGLAHHREIFSHIPQDTLGVRVLVGCECEYCGGTQLSISPKAMEEMDFINIPIDHFHMKDLVCPSSVKTLEELSQLYLRRFHEILELPLPWHKIALAHLGDVLGFRDLAPQMLMTLPEEELRELFTHCAQLGCKIEVNTSIFQASYWPEFVEGHIRFYGIARDCGCLFTIGSDAHHPFPPHAMETAEAALELLCIPQSQIFDPACL